jgi:hypothetical protein
MDTCWLHGLHRFDTERSTSHTAIVIALAILSTGIPPVNMRWPPAPHCFTAVRQLLQNVITDALTIDLRASIQCHGTHLLHGLHRFIAAMPSLHHANTHHPRYHRLHEHPRLIAVAPAS